MKSSQAGIDLIKRFEGFVPDAYKCPAGVWTIGYGHTNGVQPGMHITEQTAEQLLRTDIIAAERCVNSKLLRLNQNQFDALVSFVFNVGCMNFSTSTLLQLIRNEHTTLHEIELQFNRWIYANHKVLTGLIKRRKAEFDLYSKG